MSEQFQIETHVGSFYQGRFREAGAWHAGSDRYASYERAEEVSATHSLAEHKAGATVMLRRVSAVSK